MSDSSDSDIEVIEELKFSGRRGYGVPMSDSSGSDSDVKAFERFKSSGHQKNAVSRGISESVSSGSGTKIESGSSSGSDSEMESDNSLGQPGCAVSRGISDFTNSFFKALQKDHPDNLISSPFSLSAVMAMLKVGSRGISSEEIQKVMKFPNDDSDLLNGWQALLSTLKTSRGGLQDSLATANKIYLNDRFHIISTYTDAISKYFEAGMEQLKFSDSRGSADTINAWIAKNTENKITDLFEKSDFNSATILVLVNAIYFKGQWKHKFKLNLTMKREFFMPEAESVKVDMMYRKGSGVLYANLRKLGSQIISLPFKDGNLSMLIVLPNKISGLPELEEKLADVNILDLCDKLSDATVEISLPKFTVESTLDLNQPLINLGIPSIFKKFSADFGGISTGDGNELYVSQVIQKAFIKVDEEGAEAAAATAIKMKCKSAGPPPPEVVRIFNANHPFIYIIMHDGDQDVSNPTRTILFYGRFSKPDCTS